MNKLKLFSLIGLLCINACTLLKAEGSIINLLQEKGILTEEEAASMKEPSTYEVSALAKVLEQKGILTADEVASLETSPTPVASTNSIASKESNSIIVFAKDKAVKKLTLSGRIHAQFDNLSTSYDSAADPQTETNFYMRRIRLGAKADLGAGIKGEIIGNFGETTDIDKAYISVPINDYHHIEAGYQKSPLGFEETTSSSKIKAVERSIATRYFTEQLDLGTRFTGVTLKGEYDSGIYFAAAITNPEAGSITSSSATDDLALWLNTGWKGEFSGMDLETGFSIGRVPMERGGNSVEDTVYSLYANLKGDSFALLLEYLGGNIEDAVALGDDANPYAFTIQPSWMISDKLELVGRVAYVNADGGIGADISSTTRRAPDSGNPKFDEAISLFLGGNWYIKGNSVKLTAGYEWAEYTDNLTGAQGDAEVNGFRTRLQLLF